MLVELDMRAKVEALQVELSKQPQYEPITSHTFHGGMYCRQVFRHAGVLVVGNITRDGPAAKAGLKRGDVVFGLDDKPIKGLADFYKRLWSMGEPGVEVPLRVMQADGVRELRLQSGDRYKNMRAQPT